MKKQITFGIFIATILLLVSCSKEAKLKNDFIDKVWVIDSIKFKSADLLYGKNKSSGRTWNNILKPTKDSIFDIYQDQTCKFDSFKISNDTLYIIMNGNNKKIPFRFVKVNDYTSKLVSLDKKRDDYEYYITDLTDLFKGKFKNNSKLYNKIAEVSWTPIKINSMGETIFDKRDPEFYTKESAFQINKDSLKYPLIFKNTDRIQVTEKGIYFFNTKKKELLNVYRAKFKGNILQLSENNTASYVADFKKIEESMLVAEKDLPKKVRLGCSESYARLYFNEKIISNDSRFYFDKSTINLISENDNNCEYTYTIIYQSKEFRDINKQKTIKISFTEDEKINLEFL